MEDDGIFIVHLIHFTAIWSILQPFGLFCGHLVYVFCGHLVYFMVIWYIFPRVLYREKSGNAVTS
jgi:hypothetical protein